MPSTPEEVDEGYERSKFAAPVSESVVAVVGGTMLTSPSCTSAVSCHPPAGSAPSIDPAGALEGITCLMTETDPSQLPRARSRSWFPASW